MTAPIVDPVWLAAQVVGGLWQRVDWVAETGSTNADLVAAARVGEPGGRVLVADFQDAGRGRFDRVWQAPPRTMTAISVLLRPRVSDPIRWVWLPLVAGLAVTDGLRDATGVAASLKWPNDVLVGGRKICGILALRVDDGSQISAAAVVGMGINTTMTSEQLPVATATSLAVEGVPNDPGLVVTAILRSFEYWYTQWECGVDLTKPYLSRCATIGREVRVVISPEESVRGYAVGIDGLGQLLVEVGGECRAFAAGDVWHLR